MLARVRSDAPNHTHQQHLVQYAERALHALKSARITTDSRVTEATPKWIQAALAESRLLRPYLRGKFPGRAITETFRIHSDEDLFNQAAKKHLTPYWQRFINEGVTQYFTDRVLREQGLSEVTDHEYTDELACAKKLVLATNEDVVARAYFLNEQALREALMRRFQIDGGTLTREIGAERICTRL